MVIVAARMECVKRLVRQRLVRSVRFGRIRRPRCPPAARMRGRAPTTTARRLRMALKLDVTVPAEGGIELGAWLFLPEGDGIRPAITMAHGFGGTREYGLERFA